MCVFETGGGRGRESCLKAGCGNGVQKMSEKSTGITDTFEFVLRCHFCFTHRPSTDPAQAQTEAQTRSKAHKHNKDRHSHNHSHKYNSHKHLKRHTNTNTNTNTHTQTQTHAQTHTQSLASYLQVDNDVILYFKSQNAKSEQNRIPIWEIVKIEKMEASPHNLPKNLQPFYKYGFRIHTADNKGFELLAEVSPIFLVFCFLVC